MIFNYKEEMSTNEDFKTTVLNRNIKNGITSNYSTIVR